MAETYWTDTEIDDHAQSDEEREDALASNLQGISSQWLQWYNNEIQESQAAGLAYYLDGSINQSPYYSEVGLEGSASGLVSRDVAEVVDWLVPDLKRVLLANENFVEFRSEANPKGAKINTKIVNKVIRSQSEIDTEIDNWIKNGLLMKVGIIHVYPVDPLPIVQEYKDINSVEKSSIIAKKQPDGTMMVDNPNKQRMRKVPKSEEYPDGYKYSGVFERRKPRQIILETVPNEDFIISNDVERLSQRDGLGPSYVGRRFRSRTLTELLSLWPEHEEKIKKATEEGEGDQDTNTSGNIIQNVRSDDYDPEDNPGGSMGSGDNIFARKVTVYEEWYRYDWDKDGIAELRHIVRINRTIISNEQATDNPFVAWHPHPMPHRFYGESLADKLMMLQDNKTMLIRAFSDSAALGARPRIAFDVEAARENDVSTLVDLLDHTAGGVVRTAGNPAESVMPLSFGGDGAKLAIEGMNYLDTLKFGWGGVSQQQQGINPESLSRVPKEGAEMIAQAGNGRKEYLARRLAVGMEDLAHKIVVCYKENIVDPTGVLIDGQPEIVMPFQLIDNLETRVHISGALGSRRKEIENIMATINMSNNFVAQFGPSNPFIGIKEMANLYGELLNAYGFKDSGRFMKEASDQELQEYFEGLQNQEDPAVTVKKIEQETAMKTNETTENMNKYRLDMTDALEKMKMKIEAAMEEKERSMKELIAKMQSETQIAVARIAANSKKDDKKSTQSKSGK